MLGIQAGNTGLGGKGTFFRKSEFCLLLFLRLSVMLKQAGVSQLGIIQLTPEASDLSLRFGEGGLLIHVDLPRCVALIPEALLDLQAFVEVGEQSVEDRAAFFAALLKKPESHIGLGDFYRVKVKIDRKRVKIAAF
jgi:hypothetical protein